MLTKFDTDLLKLEHYQNFPQMLPFIGDNYEKTRLLIIGESHYLPTGSTIQQNAENWYASNAQDLNKDELNWTNIRGIIGHFFTEFELKKLKKSRLIFLNTQKVIQECGKNNNFDFQNKEGFEHIAFYDFFQRPAEKQGGSISFKDLDKQKAKETLKHIIEIINPKFIFFVSIKAWEVWKDCLKYYAKNIEFSFSPHPSCKWWNTQSKKYGGFTGKEKFIKFLENNKIFS